MEPTSGLVLVNKEANMTSQAVVTRVKRLFGAAKAGHTGTLDPMATGVLPVLVGRAVKASYDVKVGDVLELKFGEKTVKVEVLQVADNVGKADAVGMYKEIV